MLRFVGNGDQKKNHQKSPPFLNAKFPGKFEEKVHKSFLESGQGKIFFTGSVDFSPVDFSFCSRFPVRFVEEIAPKCGEPPDLRAEQKRAKSCHVSGRHVFSCSPKVSGIVSDVSCNSAAIRIRIRIVRCERPAKRQKHKPCKTKARFCSPLPRGPKD